MTVVEAECDAGARLAHNGALRDRGRAVVMDLKTPWVGALTHEASEAWHVFQVPRAPTLDDMVKE